MRRVATRGRPVPIPRNSHLLGPLLSFQMSAGQQHARSSVFALFTPYLPMCVDALCTGLCTCQQLSMAGINNHGMISLQ